MKSVLVSIQPRWVESIVSGKKTLEIRKTVPKLETPFKCYIYCTKGNVPFSQTVVGEFVCKKVTRFSAHESFSVLADDGFVMCADVNSEYFAAAGKILRDSCLTGKEMLDYIGDNKVGFAWHISDVVIYDEPKELNDFHYPPEKYCEKELCGGCPYDEIPNEYGEYEHDCEWKRPIARPPQSWCYVKGKVKEGSGN